MKKYMAIPKTAEEITGITGCTEFSGKVGGLDFYYSFDMNELAKEEKRIDLEIYIDGKYISGYDYIDKYGAGHAWKKGWLKDIREVEEKTWKVGDSIRVKQFDGTINLNIISTGGGECILLRDGGHNCWTDPIKVSSITRITRKELNLMLGGYITLLEE